MSSICLSTQDCQMDEQLNENGFCSGSARYGNFINYYNFNPPENRVQLMPDYTSYLHKNMLDNNVICLDIGCNTGELTHALQKHLTESMNKPPTNVSCYFLAVDLDEHLIERAKSSNQNQLISFLSCNVLSDDFKHTCEHYLKDHNRGIFDIAYCFSVSMWIHMNHGDAGLKQFLLTLGGLADLLVVEAQPWKCYGRAVRRMKRTNSEPFQHFADLKIRRDVEDYIDSVLTKECNFKRVMQTAPTNWKRQVKFYKRCL